jgi:maltose phosphorylase
MVFRIYVQIQKVSLEYPVDHKRITEKVKITDAELQSWKSIGCYVLSFSEEHNVYLQQDGFLDKELVRSRFRQTKDQSIKMVLG